MEPWHPVPSFSDAPEESVGVELLSSEESAGAEVFSYEESTGGTLEESSGFSGSMTLTVKLAEGPSTEVKVMVARPTPLARTDPSA